MPWTASTPVAHFINYFFRELTLENDKNKSDVESLSKRLEQTLQQLEETLSQNSQLKTSLVETESKLKSAKMNQNQKQSCTECHELQKELEQKRHENVQVSLLRAQMMKMKEVTNQEVAKMQQILALRDKEISVLRQGSLACMKPEPKWIKLQREKNLFKECVLPYLL